MPALVGSSDEYLRSIENSFPRIELHVRGNEINLSRPADEVKLANQLFSELITGLKTG